MAVKAANQMTLLDVTDGYTVVLTNDNYTFLGDEDSVSSTQSTTCTVQVLQGANGVPCSIGEISDLPEGLSIVSDGKTPNPTLTITATSALASSGSVEIPVVIGDITINKAFSWSIAFKGQAGEDGTSVTITSTSVTYQAGTSGTTEPTGDWLPDPPEVTPGQYLWTKTVVNYSDGKSTTAYSVSRSGVNGTNGTDGADGADGTSITITSQSVTYQVSTSGTTEPSGEWESTIPDTPQGEYLWTRTIVTYSDGTYTTSYSVSRNGMNGSNGTDGADAITLVITSSAGTIFKNTAIATTLTAHVYVGGAEVTGNALTELGTIKWYKDGGTSPVATGQTLTVSAGDVENKANYTAQLED